MINNENTKNNKKENRKYLFVKEYENFVLYEEMWTGIKECFHKHELGLIEEKVKARNLSPEKVRR